MRRRHNAIVRWCLIVLVIASALFAGHKVARHRVWQSQQEFCQALCISYEGETNYPLHPLRDGDRYVFFIPAHWDNQKLLIRYDSRFGNTLKLSDKVIDNEWQPIAFALGKPVQFHFRQFAAKSAGIPCQIYFYQSKVGSIFINTASGSFNDIDDSKDKSHKESGSLLAVTADGQIDYDGVLECVHGRGNMTWNIHKKPYAIEIKDKASLFGLKESRKFNLLANALDESNLRNWIMFNTAQQLHMPFAIHAEFVTLYRNGQYHGLYQITNKVDVSSAGVDIKDLQKATQKRNETALKDLPRFSIDRNDTIGFRKGVDGAQNPDDITGGYLLDMNFKIHRLSSCPSTFIPTYGYPIEIKSPKYATREQVEYISNYFEEMYAAIRSYDGRCPTTHKHFTDYIDLDSFIEYYLCSEIFYNFDANFASLFMYKDCGGKLFCGPVWDYDLSLNTKIFFYKANGTNSFFVREGREKDGSLMLFGQLYKHPEYKKRLIQIFNQKFLPILRSYTTGHALDSIQSRIADDIRYNDIIWGEKRQHTQEAFVQDIVWNERARQEYAEVVEKGDFWNIKNFLTQRMTFFESVWRNIDNEEAYTSVYWDFGHDEDFQHISTQVAYLVQDSCFHWPRYIISNYRYELLNIVNADGQPQDVEWPISPRFKMNYKTLTTEKKD